MIAMVLMLTPSVVHKSPLDQPYTRFNAISQMANTDHVHAFLRV